MHLRVMDISTICCKGTEDSGYPNELSFIILGHGFENPKKLEVRVRIVNASDGNVNQEYSCEKAEYLGVHDGLAAMFVLAKQTDTSAKQGSGTKNGGSEELEVTTTGGGGLDGQGVSDTHAVRFTGA